jgi:hypothetical protein
MIKAKILRVGLDMKRNELIENKCWNFESYSKKIAGEVNEFIQFNASFELVDPNSKRGIGYKRQGRLGGFAKHCTDRKCLILRFGKSGDSRGLQVQEEINKALGQEYHRTPTDNLKYIHEAFINLEFVKDLDDIKPFILKAYNLKS